MRYVPSNCAPDLRRHRPIVRPCQPDKTLDVVRVNVGRDGDSFLGTHCLEHIKSFAASLTR